MILVVLLLLLVGCSSLNTGGKWAPIPWKAPAQFNGEQAAGSTESGLI
jgi:hypothetical protein